MAGYDSDEDDLTMIRSRFNPPLGMGALDLLSPTSVINYLGEAKVADVRKRTPLKTVCGICHERTETAVVVAKITGLSKYFWRPIPCFNPCLLISFIIAFTIYSNLSLSEDKSSSGWEIVRSFPGDIHINTDRYG